MPKFEEKFQAACASGMLPGVVIMAASKSGDFTYTKTMGVRSAKPGESDKPMELDSVLTIASCTKLMTAIAALQCVEHGLFSLDEDVSVVLPEVRKFGIITGFDDSTEQPNLVENTKPITLRHLLSHSSGYNYDFMNPLLQRWRATRGEKPWCGPTVEEKSTLPLIFEPGTSWAYGAGFDWAGKMIERRSGETLEAYMSKNLWRPLGINDITFWPKERADMQHRMATLSMLDPSGSGKAFDLPDFDINYGATDCVGGGGAFASSEAYMAILQAVLREDPRLLQPESYMELFKPQLSETSKIALDNLLHSSEQMQDMLGLNVPLSGQKTWSLGGLLSMDEYRGWMGKNTLLWAGLPNLIWFIDRERGLCGFVGAQILPPMMHEVMTLCEEFQHEIYEMFAASEAGFKDTESS